MTKIKKILLIVFSFVFGIGLFYLIYKGQDWNIIFDSIRNSKYHWLFISAFLGILSHISRSVRWKYLIEPAGYKPRVSTLFLSVMSMYFINLGIPRAGEIFRCSITSKKEKIPFSFLLGTIITERVIDVIFLFLLIILAFLFQFNVFSQYVKTHPEAFENLANLLPYIIALIVLGILALIFIYLKREKIKKTNFYQKFKQTIENFIKGIKSVLKLKKVWLFLIHSVFIWTMYFVMIYVCFKAFDFTANLNILAGLMVFVMASLGMVAPSPGGLGPWHAMAIATLLIYGVNYENAKIFAFATHGTQTLMLIIVGGISLLITNFVKPENSEIQKK